MKKGQKKYGGKEKLSVALEILSEKNAIPAVCKGRNISPSAAKRWVKELKERGHTVYENADLANDSTVKSLREELEATRARLGELVVENDFLKKASARLSEALK